MATVTPAREGALHFWAMPHHRDLLATVLGEATPAEPEGPGPWRVTGRLQGQRLQISNRRRSRVIRAVELEHHLRNPERP